MRESVTLRDEWSLSSPLSNLEYFLFLGHEIETWGRPRGDGSSEGSSQNLDLKMITVTTKQKIVIGIVLVILLLSLIWNAITVYGRGRNIEAPTPAGTQDTLPPSSIRVRLLNRQVELIPSMRRDRKFSSRIIYMIQTESCLPKHLNSADGVGDTNACQCDVLVLSYKQQCNRKPPEHVEYLFKPSVSWNVGRNLLLEVAKKRDQKYLYYTLMDDDVTLKVEGMKPQNPWRLFENFLRELEPALASIGLANTWICNFKAMYNSRKNRGCILNFGNVDNIPTPFYDPAINAFHYEAVEHILPYTTRYDNISWWWSGFYAGIRSEIMFPGQVVAPTKLLGINNKARPYPRKSLANDENWRSIVDAAGADLPEQYRNVILYKEWRTQGPIEHFLNSSSLCLPPSRPHMMIKPFAYLEQDIE